MLPIPSDLIIELLVNNSDAALAEASQNYDINGFAYVFEVWQPHPSFYFAINIVSNGTADPSTGEWSFPAGGFDGDNLSEEWQDCYDRLDSYMTEDGVSDEELVERLIEVHSLLRRAMKMTRERWLPDLPECVFTVNECDEDDEDMQEIFNDINQL